MEGGYAAMILCTYGFFKEFRPSESFLTPYLMGSDKNFTEDEVNQEIYPVGTYSTLCLLVVIFLVTDILRYNPVVITQGISGVIAYGLLISGTTIPVMQSMEVFYGLFIASDVAYCTYIYASCEREMYQRVTSYTRLAVQMGRFLSGLVSQLVISFMLLDYHQLHFLSLAGLSMAAIFGFLLPPSKNSLYFHPPLDQESQGKDQSGFIGRKSLDENDKATASKLSCHHAEEVESCLPEMAEPDPKHGDPKSGLALIWADFCVCFSDSYVLKWSIWWACTHCGYLQVTYYIQNLWQATAIASESQLYNGAASAIYTVSGIIATWAVGHIQVNMARYCHWLLSVCALFAGVLITVSSLFDILLIQYAAYGGFKVLYQVMMTFANSEVAASLERDSHGLVFGFNTFIAVLLQTILTVVVTGKGGLELPIKRQFLVYGAYFVAIGIGFGVWTLINACKVRKAKSSAKQNSPEVLDQQN